MPPSSHLKLTLTPHLDALSASSASLLTPLTFVLNTLIAEMTDLRNDHNHLRALVSNITSDHHNPTDQPLDPDLTQPPSPVPAVIPSSDNLGLPTSHLHSPAPLAHVSLQKKPASSASSASASPSPPSSSRLKRQRRTSSRRSRTFQPQPLADPSSLSHQHRQQHTHANPQNHNHVHIPTHLQNEASRNASPPSKLSSKVKSSPSLPVNQEPIVEKKTIPSQRIPLRKISENVILLPTTPVTAAKPKKRKRTFPPASAVIEGFRSPVAAVRAAEQIQARRNAANLPRALREHQRPLSENICSECDRAFKERAANDPHPNVTYQRLARSGCRHSKVERPSTPEGYWNMTYEETQTQPP